MSQKSTIGRKKNTITSFSLLLGQRITAARRNVNISQEALAEKIEMHWQTLFRWENGIGEPPPSKRRALQLESAWHL